MTGELHVEWVHVEGCPERRRGFLNPSAPSLCRCGMPPLSALEVVREIAVDALRKGLEEGSWTPPGGMPEGIG